MKILHVHSYNLKIFENAFEGTGCHVNGSRDIAYMLKSIQRFNCRDVMGLVVYRKNLTKKALRLIEAFDDLFVFEPRPIVVVCDDASQLYKEKKIRVKNSPLFLVDSIDGTISDTDVNRIMTTLTCITGKVYALDEVESSFKKNKETTEEKAAATVMLADEVLSELARLGGS